MIRIKILLLLSMASFIMSSCANVVTGVLFPTTTWYDVNKGKHSGVYWGEPSFQWIDANLKIAGLFDSQFPRCRLFLYIKNESKYPITFNFDDVKVFSLSKNSPIPSRLSEIEKNGRRVYVYDKFEKVISVNPSEAILLHFESDASHLMQRGLFIYARSQPNIRDIKISLDNMQINSKPINALEFIIHANRE